jgi:hypothetical protein
MTDAVMTPNAPEVPMHWFIIVHVVMAITPGGQSLMRHFSATIPRTEPSVPMFVLGSAQESAIEQMVKAGMARDNIKGVSFISSSYLGQMTQAEFLQGVAEEAISVKDHAVPEAEEPVKPVPGPTPKTPYDIN